MAFKLGANTVINEYTNIGHESFDLGGDGAFLTKVDGNHGTGPGPSNSVGESVAVGSGRVVVGNWGNDDNGTYSGCAYIFDLDGNFVSQINGAHATGADVGDCFGISVAAGSGRVVVGAYGDDVNGPYSGSAYIFDLDGTFINKITAFDGAADDQFGLAVAVGSGRVVIGADGDDDHGSVSGSAYIFDLDGTFITKIDGDHGTGAAVNDLFGFSVAAGSGRVVVGAYGDDDNGSVSGSAYIFDIDGNFIKKIDGAHGTGAVAGDRFGHSVAVGSGRIVVGAYGDGSSSGSAYIFDLDGNFINKITAFDANPDDQFGRSVAVGSGRIVVGAYGDGSSSGSAYIFDLDGSLVTKITAADGAASDNFGLSADVGSGRVIAGAPGNGVNGSAYIYSLNETTDTYFERIIN